jgi:hypothetical protein
LCYWLTDADLKRDVDLNDIHSECNDLLRIAASIGEGCTSATYLLERLGSAAPGVTA